MPAYRQILQYQEDGIGLVTAEMIVSDTFADLFIPAGFIDVDIFDFNDSVKDLEEATGVQKEDEFEFSMHAAKVSTADESACFAFILQSESQIRWVATFLHETANYTSADRDSMEFVGKIRPSASGTDFIWHGNQWETDPHPHREWKLKAQSFGAAVLDSINLETETIEGVSVTGIINQIIADSAWVSANIVDKQMFIGDIVGTESVELWILRLVNFNSAMEKLRVLAEARIQETIPGFSLVFNSAYSGFKFETLDYAYRIGGGSSADLGTYYKISGSPSGYANDVKIFDANSINSPFVSWFLFDPDFEDNWQKGNNDAYAFKGRKNLTTLLYKIANNFGFYLSFKYISNGIEVTFSPSASIVSEPVYIKDAVKGSINIDAVEKSVNKKYKGHAHHLAVEGADCYDVKFENDAMMATTSKDMVADKANSELLPLTTSPTFVSYFEDRGGFIWQRDNYVRTYPHNARVLIDGGLASHDSNVFTHTSIYIYQGGYIYPASSVGAKVDGVETWFPKIADLLNAIQVRGDQNYKTKYEIEAPYLCGFSLNSNGSSPSWKNLKLGSLITLDAVDYAVYSIKRNYQEHRTNIKIVNVSKFAFIEQAVTPLPYSIPSFGTLPGESVAVPDSYGIAGEQVYAFNVAVIGDDGKYYNAQDIQEHHHKFVGFFLNNALTGENVNIKEYGDVTNPAWHWTVGLPVWVRVGETTSNVSQSPLTAKDGSHVLVLCVGVAISSNTIQIKLIRDRKYA